VLRGILGEKIKLQPEPSGEFAWAEYSLEMLLFLPWQSGVIGGRDTTIQR
jgi:hypothetical protein